MRGLVIFLTVLIVVVSVSFVAANISNDKIAPKEQLKVIEFSTFTLAVCERGKDVVRCKDEFFVNCNGKITKAVDVAECNGMRVDVPKALGFATFGKDWKDPRI
ncbi:hypothetical protein J4234_00490 [Candidatus Woesearchaeota archaeon]|nr:hypothetical protein [Candidatus Woesearchaeota archaeon]